MKDLDVFQTGDDNKSITKFQYQIPYKWLTLVTYIEQNA